MEALISESSKDNVHNNQNDSDEIVDLSVNLKFIEKQKLENKSLPFRIKKIKGKGLVVKVAGVFAYVSFYHMPWKYNRDEIWTVIFPFISQKVFFGNVNSITHNPLKILLNGKIAQFKRFPIEEDIIYNGIIIHKTKNEALIEIGYHYDWKYGSYTGLIHKSNFKTNEMFEQATTSQVIQTSYYGLNNDNQPLFSNKPEIKDWLTGKITNHLGKIIPVQIKKTTPTDISYFIEGIHHGHLSISRCQYREQTNVVRKSLQYLENDDIIHCKVIGINLHRRLIHLQWDDKVEIEAIYSRKLKN